MPAPALGRRIILALPVGAALIASLASCGSSAEGLGGPTRAEFAKRANAICRARIVEVKTLSKPILAEGDKLGPYLRARSIATDAIRPSLLKEMEQIEELTPPDGTSNEEVQTMLHTIERAAYFSIVRPLAHKNLFAGAEAKTAEFGLTACGHP